MNPRRMRVTVGLAATVALVLSLLVGVTPAQAAPSAPGTFAALAPTRVLDTRSGLGAARAPVAAGGTVVLQVTGRGGVPAGGVAAVLLNVTATDAKGSGYVTAWPAGDDRPTASNLNFAAGRTVPNLVAVRVGTGGAVALYNGSGGTVDLLADVAGYYLAGLPGSAGAFASLSPARLLDTRSGTGAPRAPVAGGATVTVPVTGRGGVPSAGVGAVLLNVTVTGATGAGYVTAFPGGSTRPTASNLNFVAGRPIANLVAVPVGADGSVALYNGSGGRADLLADVAGYYLAGRPTDDGAFASLAPTRLLDTRSGLGAARGPVAAVGTIDLQVTGRGGVPTRGVAAVLLNVTVVGPRAGGYVTAYPSGAARPTASNLNFAAGGTVANLVSVRVGVGGKVALYNGSGGATDLLADVAGYVLADVDDTAPGPVTNARVTAGTGTSVTLAWTNPTAADFAGVVIRRNLGVQPPTSPTAGTAVADTTGSTFTDTRVNANTTYSYALFAHDTTPNYAAAATVTVITGFPSVTSARATATTTTSISLAWTNPSDPGFAGVVIRRAVGSTAPGSPTAGTAVTDTAGSRYTDTGLTPGTTYSYALFAHDVEGRDAAGATVTARTTSPPVGPTGSVLSLGAVDWTKDSTYFGGSNWADPDVVRLYTDAAGDLGVATFHPGTATITAQTFDPATRAQVGTTKTVALGNTDSIWGGLYAAPTGDFYVATGRVNLAENDALDVVTVRRYDSTWILRGTARVKGGASQGIKGIYEPFDAGAAHMVLVGGKLVLHMSRLMYAIDGVHHQGNMTIEVDVATMTATPFSELGGFAYSSHSFQQLVTTWGDDLVVLDHGDAYPRGIQMGVTASYPASHTTTPTMLFPFNGGVGDNFTGATLTGVVSGPSGIVAVGNSIAQPGAPDGPQGSNADRRNAYLVTADPATGAHTLTWLTAFAANGSQQAGQPRVVPVGTDRFAVLLGVTTAGGAARTEYRLIDSAGTVRASASFAGLTFAAGTDPVRLGSRIFWAGQVEGTGWAYGLDVSDPTTPRLVGS